MAWQITLAASALLKALHCLRSRGRKAARLRHGPFWSISTLIMEDNRVPIRQLIISIVYLGPIPLALILTASYSSPVKSWFGTWTYYEVGLSLHYKVEFSQPRSHFFSSTLYLTDRLTGRRTETLLSYEEEEEKRALYYLPSTITHQLLSMRQLFGILLGHWWCNIMSS